MTWFHASTVVEELNADVVGFVYLITNLETNRKYVGKKLSKRSKTKTVKGKKKKVKVDSDWKTYYGSSKTLLEDVEKYGKQKFCREILHFCYSKSECTYLEAKEQFLRNVLESEEYYNDWIMCRIRKSNLKKNQEGDHGEFSNGNRVCVES